MRYDEDTITRVKEACDIVDVIGRHLELKRAGANFKGLCPFHQEKTPSFMVNPSRQIFHCFGCDTGGDVIRFVMLFEGIPFTDALVKLAGQAGIDLPRTSSGSGAGTGEKDLIFRANRIASRFYSECLMKSETGRKARDYLAARGIHADASKAFGVGYAPPGWRNIGVEMEKEGVPERIGIAAGLLIQGEGGRGPYDRFRDRIVFPIRDLSGRVLGFGGRVFGDQVPKYLNTPETVVYRKSDSLFGLDVAAPNLRDSAEVVLVEGYIDVISLHQGGIRNVVGVLGTALTEGQALRVRRIADRCVLLFDSDEAGKKAALRSGLILLEAGLQVQVAPLEEGEDPDSHLRKKGVQDLLARISNAPDILAFALGDARIKHPTARPADRFQVFDAIVPYLGKIRDRAKLGAYLKWLGDELLIEQHDLRARLASRKGSAAGHGGVESGNPESPRGTKRERLLLHILIRDPEMVPKAHEIINSQEIQDPEIADLVEKIFSGATLAGLLETVGDHWKNTLSRWALEDPVEGTEQALDDLLCLYLRERLEKKVQSVRERLTMAVQRGAEAETRKLNDEWKNLQRELSRLKSTDRARGRTGKNHSSGGEDRE